MSSFFLGLLLLGTCQARPVSNIRALEQDVASLLDNQPMELEQDQEDEWVNKHHFVDKVHASASDLEKERAACANDQEYLIAVDAGSSGSTMAVFTKGPVCSIDLLNGEPCTGAAATCGKIGPNGTMGPFWAGKYDDASLASSYAQKDACIGKICPDIAKFKAPASVQQTRPPYEAAGGFDLFVKSPQAVVATVCGTDTNCINKFTFTAGATAGSRIESVSKVQGNAVWGELQTAVKSAANPTLKAGSTEILPGTTEAWYEWSSFPTQNGCGGQQCDNFLSTGGASAQAGFLLEDKDPFAELFRQAGEILEAYKDCGLLCGTEESATDYWKTENDPEYGQVGLVSFLSGNADSTTLVKNGGASQCKSFPGTAPPTKFLKLSPTDIWKVLDANKAKEGKCGVLNGLGLSFHVMGGMDQVYGADDLTETPSDQKRGFKEWVGELVLEGQKEKCDNCFAAGSGGCKKWHKKCATCIKEYLKHDVMIQLLKFIIDGGDKESDEYEGSISMGRSYAVAQVSGATKREKRYDGGIIQDGLRELVETRDRAIGPEPLILFKSDEACISNERAKYHGKWNILFTFAYAEVLGFGNLYWQRQEPADWIDGLARAKGFNNKVKMYYPFGCDNHAGDGIACAWPDGDGQCKSTPAGCPGASVKA